MSARVKNFKKFCKIKGGENGDFWSFNRELAKKIIWRVGSRGEEGSTCPLERALEVARGILSRQGEDPRLRQWIDKINAFPTYGTESHEEIVIRVSKTIGGGRVRVIEVKGESGGDMKKEACVPPFIATRGDFSAKKP